MASKSLAKEQKEMPMFVNKLNQKQQPDYQKSLLERSSNFSNTKCPYCYRRFNQKASERHIPICKEKAMKHNKQLNPSRASISRLASKNTSTPNIAK